MNIEKRKRGSRLKRESIFCYIVLIWLSLICILPIYLVVVASITQETHIQQFGYSLMPVNPSLDTYTFLVLSKGKMLLKSTGVSFAVTVLGTLFADFIVVTFAYAITQKKSVFRFSKALSFFGWFATIFSGGVLPWYILCTQYYGLRNNLFALFIPYGMNMYNVFILRGNFRQVPNELVEAAKLEGASHSQIFLKIMIPLAKSGIVTISLFNVLMYWNDFYLPQWLITDTDYFTLQKVLYNMLANVKAFMMDRELAATILENVALPMNTAKMAVTVMSLIPIVILYPFALKYFIKGINVGGIKG